MRCILLETIARLFKFKICLNCRFYACHQCTYARTAHHTEPFKSCYHFSLEGYYKRYADFLTNCIKYYRKTQNISLLFNYIRRNSHKYNINAFDVYKCKNYTRIWFKMENICHYCHIKDNGYEIDANVKLKV